MGDPTSEKFGLAGSGPGKDQLRSLGVLDGLGPTGRVVQEKR
jgi:hypothetical protein